MYVLVKLLFSLCLFVFLHIGPLAALRTYTKKDLNRLRLVHYKVSPIILYPEFSVEMTLKKCFITPTIVI